LSRSSWLKLGLGEPRGEVDECAGDRRAGEAVDAVALLGMQGEGPVHDDAPGSPAVRAGDRERHHVGGGRADGQAQPVEGGCAVVGENRPWAAGELCGLLGGEVGAAAGQDEGVDAVVDAVQPPARGGRGDRPGGDAESAQLRGGDDRALLVGQLGDRTVRPGGILVARVRGWRVHVTQRR
jgi:hypothetical protein